MVHAASRRESTAAHAAPAARQQTHPADRFSDAALDRTDICGLAGDWRSRHRHMARRVDGIALGIAITDFLRAPHHVERELDLSHLGIKAIRDERSEPQQLDLRAPGIWRGLARESSCLLPIGATRIALGPARFECL